VADDVSADVPVVTGTATSVPAAPAVTWSEPIPGVEDEATPRARSGARRVRARLARLVTPRTASDPVLEPLLRIVRVSHPDADLAIVERAYEVAAVAHQGQLRKSGEPYITHPLAVAQILAELGMTPPTLAAALLHDTVEDTAYSLADLQEEFGEEVAMLVDGVTKLDKVTYGPAAQAETVRKMVIAMARDIRVILIKLADRLHNARTWRYVSRESAQRKAQETLDIYAPLAHRLGMNTLKWELEDLSFATLHPDMYAEIVRLVAENAPARDEYLAGVVDQVNAVLREGRIEATVTGRPKHYYSIYQKYVVRGREFQEIFDLVGIRILVRNEADCYAALGQLHKRWRPVPGRIKDYIAVPKFNQYQSIHTTVIGPDGKPVEMQIRTYEMHRRAEYGIAAHWKYKHTMHAGRAPGGQLPSDLPWIRQLLDWQKETADPGEFLESLMFEVSTREVYVFTPKGDVLALPVGSTPVDFAYAVHTEVGHRCIGAKVNGRLVPLSSALDNGDVVEVITSRAEGAGPSRDWLGFVTSARARNKIKHWFSKERRGEAVEQGKDAIAKAIRKQHVPVQRVLTPEGLTGVATELRYADIESLYAAVGEGRVSAQSVVQRIVESVGGAEGALEDAAEAARPATRRRSAPGDPGVVVAGVSDVWVKLARCCTPVPGDDIVGYVTRGAGVSVHRRGCTSFDGMSVEPERLVEVAWSPTAASSFLVAIQVEALDRPRLLSDITRVLSDQHVNLLSASLSTTRERVARSRFTFEMADPRHLGHVLRAVRTVDGVFDAFRISQS
jgi:GTP pyrophosphokinase